MKTITHFIQFFFLTVSTTCLAQTGHMMQGVGASNMTMGGASTGQPVDISGALQWNPASISAFNENQFRVDIGLLFSSPEVSSTVPVLDGFGQPTGTFISGSTEDDRGLSPLPSLAFVWSKPESKHTFGASAFAVAGFGVTFPESSTNPVNFPQNMGGFGRIESEYFLMQVGFTWAYQLSDKLSIGLSPTFNYASLMLKPNPTANPTTAGYPSTDETGTTGFGGQVGIFFDSQTGLKLGASYKSTQFFSDFEFDNTYLDNSTAASTFNMDFPAIFSFGVGYSLENFDLAVDYRMIDYENTDGFSEAGWTQTASVQGFGWENVSVIAAGLQYKGIEKLPLRIGYTYGSAPITEDVAFFSVPATAVIKNAFQFGLSFVATDNLSIDAGYHRGMSDGATSGAILNPGLIELAPPYGAIPGSEVSYEMTTTMLLLGVNYTLTKN